MKLYRCLMIDESMTDWEKCIVAVMENPKEQDFYSQNKFIARQKMLVDSGYMYKEDEIEFWFPYKTNNVFYAKEIAEGISQCACDADYACFEYIKP